ncbi:MAG: InlB B-repeat-containing protein, partial [Tannerella sp.]|nr:InlB B-repeat-containing protein [Tannerella sp.]
NLHHTTAFPANGVGNINAQTLTNGGSAFLLDSIVVTPYFEGFESCPGPADTFLIIVNPVPKVNATPNDTVCNGADTYPVAFATTVTGASPTRYKWENKNNLTGFSVSGNGNITPQTLTNGGSTFLLDSIVVTPYFEGFEGCPGSADTFLVVVNPTATVNAIADTVYYDGQSVASLTAISPTTPASEVSFNWTNSHPSIGLAASGTGPTIPAFTASHPAATGSTVATVTVTPKYQDCTGTPETFTITVKAKPTITYDYDGGTAPSSPNPVNYVVGVGCTVSNPPTKTGYAFQGWTCTELGIFTSQNPFTVSTTATANLTLKADWGTATPYTITYADLGGATVLPPNPTSYNVTTLTFTLTHPVKTDTVFIGWTGTDIAGPFPQLNVTIPTGSIGNRTYTAKWGFLFPADTVYSCTPSVTLQSGHDGQSYEWTLPDGSTQTSVDIQAPLTGMYYLATNYGANSTIARDSVFVLYSFDSDVQVKRISTTGTKINLPQVFTVPLNPEIIAVADLITWSWSFPGGNPLTATADTVSVAYSDIGPKTVSVRIDITRGALVCTKTYTYNLEIFASARGLFVNRNAAGGAGNGSSWGNAFLTIQEALANATEGDYVWVARGDYSPDAGTSYALTRDSVEVYGGFAATETYLHERDFAANPTVLHGNGNSVIYTEGVSQASRWDGFIVEGGNARRGGGMRNQNSSVSITNSIFRGNNADNGGGLYNEGGNPILYNVEISGNTATDGGAMYNSQSSPQLTNVTLGGNYASSEGGGLYNRNGSHPVLRNTIVWGNRSAVAPGILNEGSSVPDIASSLVEGSQAGGRWNVATGTDGGNNLDTSPGFRQQGFDNDGYMQQGLYQLYDFSPAIDRGGNRYVFGISIRRNVHLQTQQDTARVSAITGGDLAGKARIDNATVDLGAYEFVPEEYSRPAIRREVAIPEVEGATTVPPAGLHQMQSHSDFVLTVTPDPDYSLENLSVTTGIPQRDDEGVRMEKNGDGSVTVILPRVTESLTLMISGVASSVANGQVGNTKVWSYGNRLYVRTDREAEVQIHTSAGILRRRQPVGAGNTAFVLPQGVYLVTLDGKIYKVVIK